MNDTLTISDATIDDIPGIRHVQRTTWFTTYPNQELGITKADLEERLNRKEDVWYEESRKRIAEDTKTHTWVAKEGNKVVGFCIAQKDIEHNRIHALYVLEEYHRKGIGSKLTEKALAWLGTDKAVLVNAASYNIQAITFYKKFGFVETGNPMESSVIFASGSFIPEIELLKTKE